MKKRTLKIAVAFTVVAVALLNITPKFSSNRNADLTVGFEANAYAYNIYEDDWKQCDDAIVLINTPTGPMPVEVDGYKNTCKLSWASDCWDVDCSILINPL